MGEVMVRDTRTIVERKSFVSLCCIALGCTATSHHHTVVHRGLGVEWVLNHYIKVAHTCAAPQTLQLSPLQYCGTSFS